MQSKIQKIFSKHTTALAGTTENAHCLLADEASWKHLFSAHLPGNGKYFQLPDFSYDTKNLLERCTPYMICGF